MCLFRIKKTGDDPVVANRPVALNPQSPSRIPTPSPRADPVCEPSDNDCNASTPPAATVALDTLRPNKDPIIKHTPRSDILGLVSRHSESPDRPRLVGSARQITTQRGEPYTNTATNRPHGPARKDSLNPTRQPSIVIHTAAASRSETNGMDEGPKRQSLTSHQAHSYRSTRESVTNVDENGEKREEYRRRDSTLS